jgi:phenylalanyl-tRNA synthetase beta chain
MHAYDLARLHEGLEVRAAREGEALRLLDGRELNLGSDVLVIADGEGAVGMAGIMGGERSAITAATSDVLLEVAWFSPAAIAGRARRHGLQTDASQRFERGVDPTGQERALARATELILAIAGGIPGPACLEELPGELPLRPPVTLRATQIERLLGVPVSGADVDAHLTALGMQVQPSGPGTWIVTPPAWRFDISIEADLIEELARYVGLDAIAERPPQGARVIGGVSETRIDERSVLLLLAARGFQEAVTFGFTDPVLQAQLLGEHAAITLRNPIASNLAVMRSSLWPGLLMVALDNQRHQRERVRLFEIATQFRRGLGAEIVETRMIAGLSLGGRLPEQWGGGRESGDLFDLKAEVSAVLALSGPTATHTYVAEAEPVPCLHPGRCAKIVRDGRKIGTLGELHPALVRQLNFTYAPQLFELDYDAVTSARPAAFAPVSAFPQIRRDISFTVAIAEPFGRIAERVSVAASTRLQELRVFDIYQGKGVESGRKSVALGLILQDLNRTLTDADADEVVAAVCTELRSSLDAKIRE